MDTRVRATIDKMWQLLGEPHSARELAKSVNLSPRRLGELFKAHFGVSPMQFLKCLRMAKAQALLESSFLSIKEVTFRSGFTDVSHFVRDFKERYGVTPAEFRALDTGHRSQLTKRMTENANQSPFPLTESGGRFIERCFINGVAVIRSTVTQGSPSNGPAFMEGARAQSGAKRRNQKMNNRRRNEL